jgi:pyruvate dehydrogenase E2 component (dihydrolipoamide acetyltransferase)
MAEFLMPKLGADMTAGTLVAWRKKPGDVVKRGDIVAEVDTDKGVIDVETFQSGMLERLLVEPGTRVPVGTPLAVIFDESSPAAVAEPSIAAAKPASPFAVGGETQPSAELPHTSIATSAATRRLPISPSARRLAAELGVDPATVRGSGPGGAITRDDIQGAAQAKPATASPAAPAEIETAPPLSSTAPTAPTPDSDRNARMRRTIAAAMSRSKREIPHYYVGTTIDMQTAVSWLEAENLRRSMKDRLLYAVLLLKATALALREVPELNATWERDRLVQHDRIHVGAAIALRQGGLIAPAIHNTDQLSLTELMVRFRDLVQRARAGGLRSSELADPTITVTSLGEQGVETVYGVIYPPQTAIVGFGKLVERPWSVEGRIVSRPLVNATLAADHRVTDGHRGGLFLSTMSRLLQEPGKL